MARAALLNIPAYDHIQPTLGVTTELVLRGETVLYYATEPHRQIIEATGAAFSAYENLPDDLLAEPNPLLLSVRMAEVTQTLLPNLLEQLRADKPDYLIYDSRCAWGWYAAQILHLPAISSMTLLMLNPTILLRSGKLLPTLQQTLESLPILTRYRDVLMELEDTYGIPGPGITDILNNTGALTLCYTSELFQPDAASFGSTVKFVGPSLLPPTPPADLPSDAPLVVCATDVELVINDVEQGNAAWRLSAADRQELLNVLPQAAACITNGSMLVVQTALYFDVPLIVIPQTTEQSLVGQQVANVGAGLRLEEGSTASVRSAVETVLANSAFRRKAAEIGASLRASGGYRRAADEILAFITPHRRT